MKFDGSYDQVHDTRYLSMKCFCEFKVEVQHHDLHTRKAIELNCGRNRT